MMTISAPPQHEIDWFFMDTDGKWRMFDSRRCNLLENMLHLGQIQQIFLSIFVHKRNPGAFEIIYRDTQYTIDLKHMIMREVADIQVHKIRRETSIGSRPIRIGEGRWSYYTAQTWVMYDPELQRQLEERLLIQEVKKTTSENQKQPYFTLIHNGKGYMFDLDENSQTWIDGSEKFIVNRQWMKVQQLQEYGRMRKQQELQYIKERKQLEEFVRHSMANKKQFQQQRKQQQQPWNQRKPFPIQQSNFNLKDLDIGIMDTQQQQQQPLPKQLSEDDRIKIEEWNRLIEQMKQENQ